MTSDSELEKALYPRLFILLLWFDIEWIFRIYRRKKKHQNSLIQPAQIWVSLQVLPNTRCCTFVFWATRFVVIADHRRRPETKGNPYRCSCRFTRTSEQKELKLIQGSEINDLKWFPSVQNNLIKNTTKFTFIFLNILLFHKGSQVR